MYANFEIRQKNVNNARKIFGNAIGMAPSEKIFDTYIELEMQLGNIDRCRKVFERYLEWAPQNCRTWVKYCQLETQLQEIDRSRALYELAVQQTVLDMPETLWKSYIEFEIEGGEYDRARELYKKLLQRTTHVRVWLSYAEFETQIGNVKEAREVYQKPFFGVLRDTSRVEERVQLFEKWREFEYSLGDEESRANVDKYMPEKVKKRRKIITEAGDEAGLEEYYDYIFTDTVSSKPTFKLLKFAKDWKKNQEE
jgi:crooked neck